MKKILVVDDSRLFSGLISKRISHDFSCQCVTKSTHAEVTTLLERQPDAFILAVLDLNLPDAPDGEVVEYVVSQGLPTIVVTGRVNDEIRDRILGLQVFDYILKGPHTLDLLSRTVRRYLRNTELTVLIVDDSRTARKAIAKQLAAQYFKTLEAGNGAEALEILQQNPSIRMLLTDYHMPEIDGFELIEKVRTHFPMDKLAIIGLSARGNPLLSSQFLKRGANDFLSKPYFQEELIWRVNQNVEMLDHIQLQRSYREQLEEKIEEQTAKINESQAMILHQEKLAAIGQLAAGVAHEINNPIGFITSNLHTLKKYVDKTLAYLEAVDDSLEQMPDSLKAHLSTARKKQKIALLIEDLPELVTDCLDGTERIKKIVTGLKSFARKDDSVQQLADINQCIEDAITVSWNEIKYKAQIERDFGDLPQTFCYPQQLSQVFMNLLVNAAHAIEKQGVISIRTRNGNDINEVMIKDTGCGIATENLEKIFEPFYTTKKQNKGTGLGMCISRDIVERHQGTIKIESHVGEGTTFVLKFPVLQGAPS